MRKIKFRIFDNDEKIMYKQKDLIVSYSYLGEDCFINTREEVRPLYSYEIMQYTGLKDKNGKEIYEGDIYKSCEGNIKLVVWRDNGFKLKYSYTRKYQGELYTETKYLELRDTSSIRWGGEVIGNIYENPELLEGREK